MADGYQWISSGIGKSLPSNAIVGGKDSDGSPIYIGRAHHGSDLVPAKIIPKRREAYIAYGGNEIKVHNYEILCEKKFQWVRSNNGAIPNGAIPGGRSGNGENLYIGRVNHAGSQTVGKVHPSHRCLYISYGGKEIPYHNNYEVFVLQ